MPRGQASKTQRVHNRAMMSGNSCRGSSYTTHNQRRGKKYSKNESKSHTDGRMIFVKYDGCNFEITYQFDGLNLVINNILANIHNAVSIEGIDHKIENYKKMNRDYKMEIIENNYGKIISQALKTNLITIKTYMEICKLQCIYPSKDDVEFHIKKFVNK